jgi:2-polyprenyl-3-methyl-5-hydroxy-6-metoxy-1,4-benzoquinol methylase
MNTRPCPNCGCAAFRPYLREAEFRIVQCAECGLTFLHNPPEDDAMYEKYYNDIPYSGSDYRSDSSTPFLAELFAINEQRLLQLQTIKSGGTLLDIGCGLGFFLKSAAEQNYNVYGSDISNNALSFAQKEFSVRCERKSIEELLAEHRTFDIVTLWHVLEHFLDPVVELKKIRLLLNDGGVCIIEVPNLHSVEFTLSRKKWKGGNHPLYHRTFFTARTLEDTVQRSGFKTARRLKLSYHIPNKSVFHFAVKKLFNKVAMDGFLDYAAFK